MPTIKFQDTFTDADGTDLESHEHDSAPGSVWDVLSATRRPTIQGNQADWQVSGSLVAGRGAISGTDVEFAEGDELFADIDFAVGSTLIVALGIHQSSSMFSAYFVKAKYNDDNTAEIGFDEVTDGPYWDPFDGSLGNAPAADGQLRLGVTKGAGTAFTVWVEPYGGGERTEVGSVEPATDITDQQRVSLYFYRDSADDTQIAVDNFTVQTPDAPEGCFDVDYTCESADETPACTDVTAQQTPVPTNVAADVTFSGDDGECIPTLTPE